MNLKDNLSLEQFDRGSEGNASEGGHGRDWRSEDYTVSYIEIEFTIYTYPLG
jgi:hypothetical protein